MVYNQHHLLTIDHLPSEPLLHYIIASLDNEFGSNQPTFTNENKDDTKCEFQCESEKLLRRISKTKFAFSFANIFQFSNWVANFAFFVRKSSRNTNRGFVSGQS